MRFKDFGTPEVRPDIVDGLVSVSTTNISDSDAIRSLEVKNREHLAPWLTFSNNGDSESRMFTVRYEDTIVGQIILWDFKREKVHSCSVSYWIDRDYMNKGITTSALDMVIGYAFDTLEIDEVDASIQIQNEPSRRVMEKIKYPSRFMVGDSKYAKGMWQTIILYTITRDDNANL